VSTQISHTGSMLEAQLREHIELRAAGMPQNYRREVVVDVLAEMTPPGWRYQVLNRPGGAIDFTLLPAYLDR
jgi:hypothetical protein